MQYASFSERGPRSTNDDRLLTPVTFGSRTYFAIADGIGGSKGGGIAAELAIECVKDGAKIGSDFSDIFRSARSAIIEESNNSPLFRNLGTTLSSCYIDNDRLYFGHVGDCRIYHLRNRGIITLTRDQTEIAELVERGIFTKKEAKKYPRRGVLLSALNADSDYKLEEGNAHLIRGDIILLVTDGIYSVVNRSDIVRLKSRFSDVNDFTEGLRVLVEDAGAADNYSAVACMI